MAQMKAVRNARELLAAQGRHGDTELAHVSPAERRLMRAWQGAEDINPHTGLPEYFSFKKVLKGVAKAAGAIAGGIVGGPAGAAVGGALATKLTGGSWKSALGTGLLSGISAYGLQQSGVGDWAGIGALGKNADLLGRVADTAATGASGAESGINWKSLLPVAAVGIGALGGGAKPPKIATGQQAQTVSEGPSWETTTRPLDRDYRRYGEDYYTYGQDAGEHQFYDEVNPVRLAEGGIARFKYGGAGTSEGHGTRGVGDRDKSGPVGRDRDPKENQFSGIGSGFGTGSGTQGPAAPGQAPQKDVSGRRAAIMSLGDPTTIGGMMNRRPGPLESIKNVLGGNPTPTDVANALAQVAGGVTGAPFGGAVNVGTGMGEAVKDVQALRDMGVLGGRTYNDPSMGRVDVVDGKAYSLGNPASDDRAANVGGLGGGMTGGRGDGEKVLATLTQTFAPMPAAGAPTGITPGPDLPAPAVNTGASRGRTQRSPEDYYRYGERPEFEFFDQVNPVTAKDGGGVSGSKIRRLKPGEFMKGSRGETMTEYSVTVKHPALNEGRWTNIPTIYNVDGNLVKLPEGRNLEDMAVRYALQDGSEYPSYDTRDQAEIAAKARSGYGGRFSDDPNARGAYESQYGQPLTSQATGGTIKGKGSGQSDEIPALLSDNEHVLDADIVAAIGDGSSDEGHRRIEAFKKKLRKEKRSAPAGKIPPASKGLGSYFGRAA